MSLLACPAVRSRSKRTFENLIAGQRKTVWRRFRGSPCGRGDGPRRQTRKATNLIRGLQSCLVLGARVELARPCDRWILSPLRLPVPPSEQVLERGRLDAPRLSKGNYNRNSVGMQSRNIPASGSVSVFSCHRRTIRVTWHSVPLPYQSSRGWHFSPSGEADRLFNQSGKNSVPYRDDAWTVLDSDDLPVGRTST